jgi:hypothetical protein
MEAIRLWAEQVKELAGPAVEDGIGGRKNHPAVLAVYPVMTFDAGDDLMDGGLPRKGSDCNSRIGNGMEAG